MRGEQTVSVIVDDTELGQANVSKHLRVQFDAGFVRRRKEGIRAVYELIDHTTAGVTSHLLLSRKLVARTLKTGAHGRTPT